MNGLVIKHTDKAVNEIKIIDMVDSKLPSSLKLLDDRYKKACN